jgi:hypothetical protein
VNNNPSLLRRLGFREGTKSNEVTQDNIKEGASVFGRASDLILSLRSQRRNALQPPPTVYEALPCPMKRRA